MRFPIEATGRPLQPHAEAPPENELQRLCPDTVGKQDAGQPLEIGPGLRRDPHRHDGAVQQRDRAGHSPLFWSGVVLFLAAITIYVLSDDLSWRPRVPSVVPADENKGVKY